MFYKKGIDICNAKSMFEFINNHFKYDTMNSWNRLKSIANNLKLYNLNLDGDWTVVLSYLYDEEDIGDLGYLIHEKLVEWEKEHPGYCLGFNGRSGGYLVIYNKERDGRVNFRDILPDCLTGYDSYEDWKQSIKESWYNESVKDYLPTLREYTKLIQDFDKLCDELRDLANEYSKMDYEADRQAYDFENGVI